MATHPKVLGLTLDPKLTYSTHIHNISVQAHKPLQIIKALTATGWGKQKETLMATYKAVMRPALYASSVWSPIASSTSIKQTASQAERSIENCHRMHTMTQTYNTCMTKHSHFPYTSTYSSMHHNTNKNTQHPSHPLHKHTTYFNTPRLKKPTIFKNGRYTTNIPTDPTLSLQQTQKQTCAIYIHLLSLGI